MIAYRDKNVGVFVRALRHFLPDIGGYLLKSNFPNCNRLYPNSLIDVASSLNDSSLKLVRG
jgi:hypothetical protein